LIKSCNLKRWKQVSQNESGFISFLFGLILVTVIFLIGLLFQALTFSTPADIKDLKGSGTKRTYDSPYSEVFQAAIYLINEKNLTVIESSENKGYIIVSEDADFYYNGRIIALFFSESSKGHTQVEVVSKFMALPPIKELILPRNRPSQVLNGIGENLGSNNGKK
jgi:hypothetical protein